MTHKLLKLATAAAIALTPFAALSQTSGRYLHERDPAAAGKGPSAAATEKASSTKQQLGPIQKQTDPRKNGRSQSQSVNGMNKNGQSQATAAMNRDHAGMQQPGPIQKQTAPRKNGTTQSQSVNGMNKNGQPQR